MFVIFLVPILFVLSFRFFLFKERFQPFNQSGDFILSLYLASMILSVIFYLIYSNEISVYDPSLIAMIYFSFALIIYLFPLLYFQNKKIYGLDIIDLTLFKFLSWFFIIGSIYSIVVFIPKVINVFSSGVQHNRLMLNSGELNVFDGSIFDTIAVGFSAFFSFLQIMGMLVIFFKLYGRKSNFIGFLMLICSTSYIFNAMAFAGRDGVVFWFFSFLFNYTLLKAWLGIKLPKFSSKLIWLSLFLFSLMFFYMSYSRFSSTIFFSMLNYFAQQLINFNDLFVLDPPIYNGSQSFFKIKSYITSSMLEPGDLNYHYLSNNVYPWVFKFFIGSFVADFGKLNTLFVLFLFSAFVFFVMINKKKSVRTLNIYQVLIFSFYGQVGYMGVFYFKHSSLNNYILALFLLSIFLYFFKALTKRSFILVRK